MNPNDREPLATIALIAAFADGFRGPEEVAQLQLIAKDIGGSDYDAIARSVLSGKTRLADVAGRLSAEARPEAYELAVCVVHADGVANEREKVFLAELKVALGLDAAATAEVESVAAGLGGAAAEALVPEVAAVASTASSSAQDEMILNNAMLAGALELLPQNLATLAIVPLQLRMVYKIGQDHGQKLDANQVKDLAGAVGIGAAGQVMEGVARKLLGGLAKGLFGRMLGGVAGGVASTAAGAGLTFATTYALGNVARQYYAQGRTLSREDLRALFGKVKVDANGLYPKVEARIREQARTLNLSEVLKQVRS
jgi:uncharacterized protein (DUF697 family)